MNPGESYDPLLKSFVNSTSVSADEGGRQVKDGFLSFEKLCMCAIQKVNGQDKIFRCL